MSTTVSLNELLDELNLLREDATCYLNPHTGEVYTVTEADRSLLDLVDNPDYVSEDEREEIEKVHQVTHSRDFHALPNHEQFEEAMTPEAFCDYMDDQAKCKAFREALDGQGLEKAIAATDLSEEWYAFKDETLARITREWLAKRKIPFTADV